MFNVLATIGRSLSVVRDRVFSFLFLVLILFVFFFTTSSSSSVSSFPPLHHFFILPSSASVSLFLLFLFLIIILISFFFYFSVSSFPSPPSFQYLHTVSLICLRGVRPRDVYSTSLTVSVLLINGVRRYIHAAPSRRWCVGAQPSKKLCTIFWAAGGRVRERGLFLLYCCCCFYRFRLLYLVIVSLPCVLRMVWLG